MVKLRTVLIVLVVLNILAFAALQGWLGSSTTRGEPERLTNQLNPERIRLKPVPAPSRAVAPVAPPPSPAPVVTAAASPTQAPAPAQAPNQAPVASAAVGCVAVGTLNAEGVRGVEESLAGQGDLTVRDVPVEVPSSWWVNLPPQGNREGAEARVAELRQLGVSDNFIVQEPGPNQFAVSLGLFKQAAQAERLQEQLRAKGLKDVRITTRGSTGHRVEIRGPAERLPRVASEIVGRHTGASQQECQP